MATINGFIRSYGAAVKRIERNQKKEKLLKDLKNNRNNVNFRALSKQ